MSARYGIPWIVTILFLALPSSAQTVGQPLPPWSPGELDIHQILTGIGNAALLILPDGTSLLVDAGDGDLAPPQGAERAPNASRPPGEWIARYARRMLAHDAEPAIDYALVTHFHGDHMAGFSDVSRHIPIRTLLDRGWPNYDYPRPVEGDAMDAYRGFIEAQRSQHGMIVERLQPGGADQIVLTREPEHYPGFEVRNLAANGEVWTGVGTTTRHHFPPLADIDQDDWPNNENQCSMAIRVSYGAFDWYTGGDMPGRPFPGYPAWHAIEIPVARAAGPVDAVVLNHHGFMTATSEEFVRALRARVWIIPSRSAGSPGRWPVMSVQSKRLYPGPRDIFALTIVEAARLALGPVLNALSSQQGHIVIRVSAPGDRYRVFILDETTEQGTIRAVHGPYKSR